MFTIAFGDNVNERIKELEKQCWSHRVDGVLVDGHLHFDTQKFAELIVQECAHLVDTLNEAYEAPSTAGKFIKEHFGVE